MIQMIFFGTAVKYSCKLAQTYYTKSVILDISVVIISAINM